VVKQNGSHQGVATHVAHRTERPTEWSAADEVSDQVSSPSQARLYAHPGLAVTQRRQLVAQIGSARGNQHLQRLLVAGRPVQRQEAPQDASPGALGVAADPIPPQLRTSIDLAALGDAELQARADLIAQTLLLMDQSTPDTVLLEAEAERIRHELAERQVEARVRAGLEGFLGQFEAITVTVRWVEETATECVVRSEEVAVHPPYFMNVTDETRPDAAERTIERHDTAVANRGAAERTTRDMLSQIGRSEARGGMGIARANVGKSHPEDIQRIVQAALDRNEIEAGPGRNRPNSEDLRNWLVHYGIGVDCSAFVSQALNEVTEQISGTPLAASERISLGSGGLRGGAAGFTRVADPTQLQPGDTMYIPGHIRIVTAARRDPDGAVIFSTAESRAGGGDIGPDAGEWRYFQGQLQLRRSPDAEWGNSQENPTYGRYNRLAGAMERAAE
jgi:hypothetical protein